MRLFAFILGFRLTLGSRGKMRQFQIGAVLAYAMAALVLYSSFLISDISNDRQTRLIATTAMPAQGVIIDFYIRNRVLSYKQFPLTIELVGSDHPDESLPPPGLEKFPSRGIAYVSPELRKEIAHDSSLAFRLPGVISSQEIRPAGLVSPNELRAIIGVNPDSLRGDMASIGWGAVIAGYTDSLIPTSAFVLSAVLLVGLPLVLLLLVIGKLADSRRIERNKLFTLVGMDSRYRLRVESTETFFLALVGGVGGGFLGITLSSQIGEAFFGFESFPVSFRSGLLIFLKVQLILISIAILLTKLRHIRYRKAYSGKSEKVNLRLTGFKILAGLSALSLMSIFLLGKIHPDYILASSFVTVLLVVSSFGLMLGSYKLIEVILIRISHLKRFQVMDLPIFLAVRQIRMTSANVARSSAGFLVILVISAISTSFLYDLNSLSQTPPEGRILSITVPKEGANGAIFKVPSKALIYIMNGSAVSNPKSFGSCESVRMLVGNLITAKGEECQNNRQYNLVSSGSEATGSTERVLVIPNWKASVLGSTSTLVTMVPDESTYAEKGDLIIASLKGTRDLDGFISRVMKIQPLLYIDYINIDTSLVYRLPLIRRIVYSLTFVGFLIGICTFYLGQLKRFFSRKQSRRFLSLLGTPRSILDESDELEFSINAWTVLVLGTVVGGIISNAYLALGGHHDIFLYGVIIDLTFGSTFILLARKMTKHLISN